MLQEVQIVLDRISAAVAVVLFILGIAIAISSIAEIIARQQFLARLNVRMEGLKAQYIDISTNPTVPESLAAILERQLDIIRVEVEILEKGLIYDLTHGPSGPESSPLIDYTGGLRTASPS